MRQSNDEIRDGRVYNGFDYALQVWVVEGIIQPVGMGRALAGQSYAVPNAQKEGKNMSLPCGCELMEWCPLHAKAPEMYELLDVLIKDDVPLMQIVEDARALLREITEGE